MPQFLRPDGVISQGNWTGSHLDIDEPSPPVDSDLVYSQNNPNGSVFEVSLSNPAATPGAGTTTVRFRHGKVNNGVLDGGGTAVTLDVILVQGTTTVATLAQISPTGTWTTATWTPDTSLITDWNDVRIRFTASGGSGSTANRRGAGVTWAEVEVPDAPVAGLNADLSQSLSAASIVASATLAIGAALTQTLGGMALAAEATAPVNAELTQTLGGLGLTASGGVAAEERLAVLDQTFGALALDGAATVPLTTALNQALGAATVAADADAPVAAALTQTLGAATLGGNSYSTEVSADAPVAWWRLAETSGTTAANIGSVVKNGTYTGGYTLNRPSLSGEAGNASVALNGTSGYIPAGAVSDYQYASNFTYEAIVKATTGAIRTVMSHGYLGPLLRIRADGKLGWLKSYSLDRGTSTGSLTSGVAHHVAVTVASNGTTTFYIDGVASGTATSATDYGASTQVFKIGVDTSSGGALSEYFLGDIDEVAIYNTALSPARIAAHSSARTANATATSTVAAALAQSLGAATLSSDVDAPLAAALTQTFGGLGLEAQGGVASTERFAALDQALGAATLAGDADAALVTTLTQTLDAASLSGAATTPLAAALSQALGAATLSSDADAPVVAALSQTFGATTLAADADVALVAAFTGTLGGLGLDAQAGAASTERTATLSQALGAATLASTATAPVGAELVQTFGPVTAASDADAPVDADLAQFLGTLALSSDADVAVQGALVQTLGAASLEASTTALGERIASLTQTLGTLGLAAQGGQPLADPIVVVSEGVQVVHVTQTQPYVTTTVTNQQVSQTQSPTYVDISSGGLQGPPGRDGLDAGGSGTLAGDIISRVNNEAFALPRCTLVRASGGGIIRMQTDAGARLTAGLVFDENIQAGQSGRVMTDGTLTASTLEWDNVTGASGGLTPDTVYYAANNGQIRSSPPTTGVVRQIGVALSTTDLLVRIEPGITL